VIDAYAALDGARIVPGETVRAAGPMAA
jgi:hypothetical protein